MHKLINATIEIIKAMASISYNDVVNTYIFFLREELDGLASTW